MKKSVTFFHEFIYISIIILYVFISILITDTINFLYDCSKEEDACILHPDSLIPDLIYRQIKDVKNIVMKQDTEKKNYFYFNEGVLWALAIGASAATFGAVIKRFIS